MSEARKQRKQLTKEQHRFIESMPEMMTQISIDEITNLPGAPMRVWRSRHFLAQLFNEPNPYFPNGLMRLSICRTKMFFIGSTHFYKDEITWDEIAQIKRECGFADIYAIEVYPRDQDLVNVANIRHIWLLATPLPIGWFKQKEAEASHE